MSFRYNLASMSNNPACLDMSWRDNVPFGYDYGYGYPDPEEEEYWPEPEDPQPGRWAQEPDWSGVRPWIPATPLTVLDMKIAQAMGVVARIYAAKHPVEAPAGFNRRGYYREEVHLLRLTHEEVEIRKVPITLVQFLRIAASVEKAVRNHCSKVQRAVERWDIHDPAYTAQAHDEEFYNRFAHNCYYHCILRIKCIRWFCFAKLIQWLRRVRHAKWMPGGVGYEAMLETPSAKTMCGKRARED